MLKRQSALIFTFLMLVSHQAHAVNEYFQAVDGSNAMLAEFSATTAILLLSGSSLIQNMSGTAATPSYSFRDSTGTGMYLAASGTVAFATAGVERMRIDQYARVGIGTTPAVALDVNGIVQSTATGFTFADGTTMASDSTVSSGLTSTLDVTMAADSDLNGSGANIFQTRNVTRMVLANTANVGLVTTSPNTGSIMDMSSTTTLSSLVVPRDTTANRPTTVANGMIRYNTTLNKFEGYENGGWMSFATEGFVRKTADESLASSTTLQDDNHLSFTALANSTYIVDLTLSVDCTNNNRDMIFTFILPSGTFTAIGGNLTANSSVSVIDQASGTASGTMQIGNVSGQMVLIRGYLSIGATGGTVNFQWAQAASGVQNLTVGQGSFLNWGKQ